jgi:ubiquinone/menaquinone biosynthesis C-methylase UbiE
VKDQSQIVEAAQRAIPSRYDKVARAFGTLAPDYDAIFDPNVVIRRLRHDLYETIRCLVAPPAKILDINCGTGTDALHLASEGYTTVGLDVTEPMIVEARRKSMGSTRASFVHTSYDDLDALPENAFDLVLSNFGGLNCTGNLRTVASHVAKRLKPDCYFVAVLMPSFSLWETCAYIARAQFKHAFRRMKAGGAIAEFNGHPFRVHYFTPSNAAQQLEELFVVRDVYAWNVLTPPPHAWRIAEAFPTLTSWLERLDHLICRLPMFRSMGDHYVMVLQKRTL